MKFNVDDRILRIYDRLPEVFMLGDIKKRIDSPMPEPTIHVNLQRMCETGLISRIGIPGEKRGRKYHRDHKSLREWFEQCALGPLSETKKEETIKVEVLEQREKEAYGEQPPRSLSGTEVLRIYDNEIWLIRSKATDKPVLHINRNEVEKLLEDKEMMRRNLEKFSIPIKAIFHIEGVVSPGQGQKAERVSKYVEVNKAGGKGLEIQLQPFKVRWVQK